MNSLSDPRSFKEYRREKELISWLSHHNQEVGKKFQDRADGRHYTRELLQGLRTERNPEHKVDALVDFVAPNPEDNRIGGGLPSFEDRKAQRVRESIEKVLQNKLNRENYNAGMNPATLMAAQRRKIILQALTDTKEDIGSSREFCKEKVEKYLKKSMESDGSIQSSVSLKPRTKSRSRKNAHQIKSFGLIIQTDGNLNAKMEAQNATTPTDSHAESREIDKFVNMRNEKSMSIERNVDAPFIAKWNSYDTMRCRWKYIKPQTKDLKTHVEAPVSGDLANRYLTGDSSEKIYGPLNNLLQYQHVTRSSMQRKQRIAAISHEMRENARTKRERVYKPDVCVKY